MSLHTFQGLYTFAKNNKLLKFSHNNNNSHPEGRSIFRINYPLVLVNIYTVIEL